MRIFITGSSGLIGSELKSYLEDKGFEVYAISRLTDSRTNPQWDFSQQMQQQKNDSAYGVIHLAGENIAAKRWSEQQKSVIYQSRVQGTKNLIQQVLAQTNLPEFFFSASAIGYYGNRGDEKLIETSNVGRDFVSKIAEDWEQACKALESKKTRLLHLRFAVVQATQGGALKKMLLPFQLGLGGKINPGNQFISWVSLRDAIRAINFCIENPSITGPVNISAPNPISNLEYTKALGKALKRPTIFPVPVWVSRFLFGEMAKELLFTSQKVIPEKLMNNGFQFQHETIQQAFESLFRK